MKIYLLEVSDGKKCSGCNWETTHFYGAGTTKEEAMSNYEFEDEEEREEYGLGLCSSCLCECLSEKEEK
jgi:hypothetical protein